jgi:hypothetical protein
MIGEVETAEAVFGGTVQRRWFDNGYGISVAEHPYAYGGREVAVIHKIDGDWTLCYCTPVTDDVIGWCTEDAVEEIAAAVAALPRNDECKHGLPGGC